MSGLTLSAGSRIGKYEVIAPIGAGGMGEVYRALDPHIRREVAIKVLLAETFTDSMRRRRLEQEARAAGALNHPNLLTIYDLGTHDGAPFIVCELLAGKTLREVLTGGRAPVQQAGFYAREIAAGLAAAHEKGVVHRDLKPENIFVTNEGRVKILDFGLAKFSERFGLDESTETNFRTEPGTVVGTLAYMAPEQVKGIGADERSDIFAFGSILFEMLTGEQAFRKKSGGETIAAILTHDPLAASTENFPDEFITIIRRCLEKDPDRRFQSARELVFALSSASAPAVTFPLSVPRRSPRRSLIIAGSLLAAAAIAVLVTQFQALPEAGARIDSIAVLPLKNLGKGADRYLADGLTEELTTSLARIHALRVIPRTSTSRYVDSNKTPLEVGRELAVDAVVTGSVLQAGNTVRVTSRIADTKTGRTLWTDQYERPIADIAGLQDDLARTIAQQIRIQMTPAEEKRLKSGGAPVSSEAHRAYLRGRSFAARADPQNLNRALLSFKEAVRLDPNYAAAHAGLADAYAELGFFGILLPTEAFPSAKEAALTALKLDPELAEAHVSLASVATHFDWKWQEAEQGFKRAIALNPNYDLAYNQYAVLLMATGRADEAIAQSRRAVALSPVGRQAIHQLPWMLYLARRHDQAIAEYRKAIEYDPDGLQVREGAADALAAAGRDAEAFAHYQQYARMAGYPQPILDDLASEYRSGGMPGYWRKRLLMEEIEQEETGDRFSYRMASLHARLNQTNEALEWLEQAYAEHNNRLIFLRADPVFDSLRKEARFQNLIDRVGISVR